MAASDSTKAPAEQTVLKPPMSRKVLASAGAAAFVLGNRSRCKQGGGNCGGY